MARKAGGGRGISIDVLGDKRLQRKLLRLEPKVQRKVVRQAMREAARPVLEAAKARVPVDSGALRDSLKIRAATKKRTGRRGQIGVVVTTEDGFFQGEQFYGAFLELGTSQQPARPYLRPAIDEKRAEAKTIAAREIAAGIKREAKKA